MVASEAFDAALNVALDANDDIKPRETEAAAPAVQVGSPGLHKQMAPRHRTGSWMKAAGFCTMPCSRQVGTGDLWRTWI